MPIGLQVGTVRSYVPACTTPEQQLETCQLTAYLWHPPICSKGVGMGTDVLASSPVALPAQEYTYAQPSTTHAFGISWWHDY